MSLRKGITNVMSVSTIIRKLGRRTRCWSSKTYVVFDATMRGMFVSVDMIFTCRYTHASVVRAPYTRIDIHTKSCDTGISRRKNTQKFHRQQDSPRKS